MNNKGKARTYLLVIMGALILLSAVFFSTILQGADPGKAQPGEYRLAKKSLSAADQSEELDAETMLDKAVRDMEYREEEQLIINAKDMYEEFMQEHEEYNRFGLANINDDLIIDLIAQEDIDETRTKWHIYKLTYHGVTPFEFEDGSEAVFDNKDPEEGSYNFYVCNHGHLHNIIYGGEWKHGEDVYEVKDGKIVLSLSRREGGEDGIATYVQRRTDGVQEQSDAQEKPGVQEQFGTQEQLAVQEQPITKEQYQSLTADCKSNLWTFKNNDEGRAKSKEDHYFMLASYRPIETVEVDSDDAEIEQVDPDLVIDWKDEVVEANIRRFTGITEGDIKYRDVCDLTRLVLLDEDGRKVRDISALKYLKNLEILHMDWQEIEDISVLAGLTRLESLSLRDNKVKDISPLQGLKKMELLDLSNNEIEDISVLANMKRLSGLYLSNNQISDITVLHELKKLAGLDLYGNKVSDLGPLRGLMKLSTLDVARNELENEDLQAIENLTGLHGLYLGFNRIQDVSALTGLCELRTLDLRGDPIADYGPVQKMGIEKIVY